VFHFEHPDPEVASDEMEAQNGKRLLSGVVDPKTELPEDRPNA
jgi:hypothetical protein